MYPTDLFEFMIFIQGVESVSGIVRTFQLKDIEKSFYFFSGVKWRMSFYSWRLIVFKLLWILILKTSELNYDSEFFKFFPPFSFLRNRLIMTFEYPHNGGSIKRRSCHKIKIIFQVYDIHVAGNIFSFLIFSS